MSPDDHATNCRGNRDELDRLVAAARDGDRPAFDELVRRTYVDTYTLALRLTAHEEDARDVVQESYLRAWKGLDGLPRRRAVHHVDVPHHREHRLHRRSSAAAGTAPSRSTRCSRSRSRLASRRPARGAAEQSALLDRLSGRARRSSRRSCAVLVVLKDVYGLSHEEIAEELGISVAAAKVRLHRGRKRLRDLLYDGRRPGRGGGQHAV